MKKALIIGLLWCFAGARAEYTRAVFADSGASGAEFAAANDWKAPVSQVEPLAAYQTGHDFSVDYSADDGETGLDFVILYYRKGASGVYALYETHDYSGEKTVSGSFNFSAVEGDGEYQFYSVAGDQYGNSEAAPASPDAAVILDTVPPVTVLTAAGAAVVDEKVENGDFNAGLAGSWGWSGQVARMAEDEIDPDGDGLNEVSISPPDDDGYMVRIGHSENYEGELDEGNSIWNNRLTQVIGKPNGFLSFYYRVVSFDAADNPAAVVSANDREILRVNGAGIDNGGYPNDTGWQRAFMDLSDLSEDTIELKFWAGNSDPFFFSQSWLYVDKITTGRLVINSSKSVLLTASDDYGAPLITYSLDNGATFADGGNPVEISGGDLSAGVNQLLYYSTDNAGNVESVPDQPTEVILDDDSPDPPADLLAIGISEHEIEAEWTAPADYGYFTRTSYYAIRISTAELTEDNFWASGAAVANAPAPAAPEETQVFTISGLNSAADYWLGISACDPAANCSVPAVSSTATLSETDTDPGEVVINELMWTGMNGEAGDEWLELRNMTNREMDIGQWQLTKKNTTDGTESVLYTLPDGAAIPAGGYFLISEFDREHSFLNVDPDLTAGSGSDNKADFSLANSNLQIKLYDGDFTGAGMLIDSADDGEGPPMAGLAELGGLAVYYSMERNAVPGDGTAASSWHTALAETAVYFDAGAATVKGTPGAENLSEQMIRLPPPAVVKVLENTGEDEAEPPAVVETEPADVVEKTANTQVVNLFPQELSGDGTEIGLFSFAESRERGFADESGEFSAPAGFHSRPSGEGENPEIKSVGALLADEAPLTASSSAVGKETAPESR